MRELDGVFRALFHYARQSPDPSTQNAAIVLPQTMTSPAYLLGVNRFPNGVRSTSERWERPKKYLFIEHAERNAIYYAARRGYSLEGATMCALWAACADCARGIVQCGIRRLFVHGPTMRHGAERADWRQSIEAGNEILAEGGVTVLQYDVPFPDVQIRFNGVMWSPC